VLFNGESDILQFLQQWSGRTNEQLAKNVTVNIALENRLEATDNGVNLIAKATATYLENTTAENRITLVLIEENVVAAQLTNSGVDSNYVHKNVARAFLTRFNGNVITAEKNSGTVIVKEFKLNNIPAAWKLNDLKVVAFIHEFGSSQKVLQTVVRGVM
jgi:hypothetical protein